MTPRDEEQHEELTLVVDDVEPSRRMLAKILDRNGYRCITAANGLEARERMREERFALVVTDVDITAASGLDLLMWLSSQHGDVATVLLNTAATLALTHHERVDGSGYPQGLKGEDIPIEGRIGAIADAFDAITTNRVYSRAVSTKSAIAMMRAGSSTHFDPLLSDAFLGDMTAVLGIKERFADPERSPEQLALEDDPRRIP